MNTPPKEILAAALEGGGLDPDARSRLAALLAGVALEPWFETVDNSPYPLRDWLRALAAFDRWLAGEGVPARPVAAMLGYLECCTLTLAPTLPLPALDSLLAENLERHGFDAARGAAVTE